MQGYPQLLECLIHLASAGVAHILRILCQLLLLLLQRQLDLLYAGLRTVHWVGL
jgi:hypothetical protein